MAINTDILAQSEETLKNVYTRVANGLESLYTFAQMDNSEPGPVAQIARKYFYALAGFLGERGIIEAFANASAFIKSSRT
jgi:hypothetical protein